MANHKTGAQRYNDRMDRIMSDAHANEKERLAAGEKPNPSLTSPEEARKHGWEIKGREVTKIKGKKHEMAGKMKGRIILGHGNLQERRIQAERANAQMRKRGTFYIPANKRAGLI